MSEPTAIEALPPEILTRTLDALDSRSLRVAGGVCRKWRAVAGSLAIARFERYRDPGFAPIAIDARPVRFVATQRDVFVGVDDGGGVTWDSRGNRFPPSSRDFFGTVMMMRLLSCAWMPSSSSYLFAFGIRARATWNSRNDCEIVVTTRHGEELMRERGISIAVLAEAETVAVVDPRGRLIFWRVPDE